MARENHANILGRIASDKLEPKFISKEQTDGKKGNAVLNFLVEVYDRDDDRFYKLPVAVWGVEEVTQCQEHLRKGDFVLIKGEIRYKFIRNLQTKEIEKIYTTIKASNVEFLTKKLKSQNFSHFINEVRLIGNLVHDPTDSEDGFVVAVDRLYPTKEITAPNSELTDYVTLVVKNQEVIKNNLKKGSVVLVDGKLMTRKREKDVVRPTIVVDVKEMVGG